MAGPAIRSGGKPNVASWDPPELNGLDMGDSHICYIYIEDFEPAMFDGAK